MRHKNKNCFEAQKVENYYSFVVDKKSNRLEVNVPTRCSPCATYKDSIFCLFNKMIAVATRLPLLCCMLYSTHSASSQFIMTKILFKEKMCMQYALSLNYRQPSG